jgi:glycosyltransferase involved in cell wall biosynthesis
VAPAGRGDGGLGKAAGDMSIALSDLGFDVDYVNDRTRTGRVEALMYRRPMRRLPSVARVVSQRRFRAACADKVQLTYAMPGYLPRSGGVRVLHQATRHPDVVFRSIRRARSEAGGGRGFLSRPELTRLRRELRDADLIRVESRDVGDELVRYGVTPERVVHAAPGVDLDRFQPVAKRGPLTVLFVGPLSLWKGLDIVVALQRALPRDVRLLALGGPVCPWSRKQASGLARFTGGDVADAMRESHVLVLPGVADGFGYVVLEALASGVIPVVTPAVGSAEIVRRLADDLVCTRDEFVERTLALLTSGRLEGLATRARALAENFGAVSCANAAARKIVEHSGLSVIGYEGGLR